MNALTETLKELVEIPSVVGNEGRLCTHLASRLMATWEMDGVERIGNSLIVGRRTARPLVLLVGHIDTIPAQGEVESRVDGGRFYGLGSSDMKAGLAVMVHLLEDPVVRDGEFDVVGVLYDKEEGPADENGLIEVLAKAPWLREADFAVVLEPTDLELQLGCLGTINALVTFTGRSAHSARPWDGENAVTKAGAWLAGLHDRPPHVVEVAGLPFSEVATVTTARGGLANNVVPSEFVANLNYRFAPNRTLEEAEQVVREIAAGADQIEFTDRAPSAPVPEGNPILDRFEEATGAPRKPKQAWTDVARLAQLGIPAVNYGPGETAQAHQAGESVAIANLDRAHQALRRFLAAD